MKKANTVQIKLMMTLYPQKSVILRVLEVKTIR